MSPVSPPPAAPSGEAQNDGAESAAEGKLRLAGFLSPVRSSATLQVGVAILVGAVAGLCVSLMSLAAEGAHLLIYNIALDEKLSGSYDVPPIVACLSLAGGGLLIGLIDVWRRRRKAAPTVDPIEANALRGGRLSLRDGLLVVAQTVISNGCGASVGLEAGYSQIGAALASKVGVALDLRRQDLRTLVGCGAAGAIAGAFAAPLAGAFYAFELIVGAYAITNAAPILAAAVAGALAVRVLGGAPYQVDAPHVVAVSVGGYGALIGLGLIAAGLGIAVMRATALVERAFKATPLPIWARPVVGGLIVASMAMATPQVLGAGHGALELDVGRYLTAVPLATLIVLKLLASLVSLGSGFRGGLFFASLFVGALLGKLYALALPMVFPGLDLDTSACIFAGMATLAVAIVGGPLTMTFLVLESTGDLPIAGAVLAAAIATSLTVRATFGYSFSTWRLHLRGELIRGAQDVGWLRELTVAALMERAPKISRAEASLAEFCVAHPLGEAHYVVLEDGAGRYAGLVSLPEAHAAAKIESADRPVAALARAKDVTLSPEMTAKAALKLFESARAEILAVTDPDGSTILGTLGEAYAARRFAEALDMAAGGVYEAG